MGREPGAVASLGRVGGAQRSQATRTGVSRLGDGVEPAQIVILLAIVLPSRLVPSRATVGRWVQQSAQQSSAILKVLDRACQHWVLVLRLDEIFFHREPILMGVEPISLAWLAGQRSPDRSGESWSQVIE